MMYPINEKIHGLEERQHHNLAVASTVPPNWEDHWLRSVPIVGAYLQLVPVIRSYSTNLEDVADLIADQLDDGNRGKFIGEFVGMKAVTKAKNA
jgi:hypothetical protein